MSNKEMRELTNFHYVSPDVFLEDFVTGLKEQEQVSQEVVDTIKKHLASGHIKSNAGDQLADDLKALAIGNK